MTIFTAERAKLAEKFHNELCSAPSVFSPKGAYFWLR